MRHRLARILVLILQQTLSQKLPWDEIRKIYQDEWVKLVDFDWDESEPYPGSGVVRVHHKDKKELKKILI